MSDAFENWESGREILDEILYRDPPSRQLEVRDGVTRVVEMISFADGSRLTIAAQVPLPPLGDMTPTLVSFLKLNGERGEKLDDGSSEAMRLARQSGALRFIEKISALLDAMPECEKMICPACQGERCCPHCSGQGCSDCEGSGVCQDCGGHGKVARSEDL